MDIDPDILRRYWIGKCTDEEIRMVKIWMEAGQPDEKYPAGHDVSPEMIREELWSSITRQAGLQTPIGKSGPKGKKRLWTASRVTYGMIAASLAVVVLWIYIRPASFRKNEIVYRHIEVPNGQKRTIILSDGTKVQLNSGSSLSFPVRFKDTVRRVVLGGEAFFSVSKDQKKPFVVETKRTQTRVLGTRFNLRDYKNEEIGSVTVEEGLVAFSSLATPSTRILLGADEHGKLLQGQLKKDNVRATDFSAWRENTLRFDDIPLSQAVLILERHYDIDIKITSTHTGRIRIKATFKEMPLEKIMEELAYLLNIRYRIENKHVNIY